MMNPCRFVHQDDSIELPPRRASRRGFYRAGIGRRGRRWLNAAVAIVVALFAIGWGFVILHPPAAGALTGVTGRIAVNPLSPDEAVPAAYLLERLARGYAERNTYHGESGKVRVLVQQPGDSLVLPDSAPGDLVVEYAPVGGDTARGEPAAGSGVWNVLLRLGGSVRRVPDFAIVRLVPLSEKRNGRIGNYMIGNWPFETGRPSKPQYAPPAGLVRVTPENLDVAVSEHFRLRDFVTKGQQNVWPKYVAMSPKLLDKLELTIQELEATGTPVEHVGIISGFRTPNYNAGGGDTRGRGALSRHMYGDAMDWYVDNNRDGRMDDLNHDGRVDRGDGRVIVNAAERVERKHPSLIGGIGLYSPTGAHAGFVHIDTRGFRARW